ncbi:MAG: type VI secretion lipoprotein TssJ, partial [Desulfovermiculus sp.]|nr:type VI secretion lipoprotein TssJ [Desulfovermiculus sp.]
MGQLLQCSRFDPSVTMTKKVVMQPKTESTLVLDRAQGTRYVGIVAGYSNLDMNEAVDLMEIPVIEETTGWIRKQTTRRLGKLERTIVLGPTGIQTAGVD